MDEYLVPTAFGEDEVIEKKSRFIGRVWPVEPEEQALEKIAVEFPGDPDAAGFSQFIANSKRGIMPGTPALVSLASPLKEN